ncbi:MAG: hypothetical protein NVS2B3_01540 [Vulcanimicrobiaceae bacterium]
MLTPNSTNAATGETVAILDLRISGVDVRVFAPKAILAILETTLADVPRHDTEIVRVEIRAELNDTLWTISAGPNVPRLIMPADSVLPQVAGAIVSTILRSISSEDVRVTRAVVIERQGRGLAIVGDDWESALTISAHLCSRGWQYVSGDHALIDSRTLRAVGFEKALHITSSSLSTLPMLYRRAVESSPWYVTKHGIAFYAVDPSHAAGRRAWSASATLRAVIVVDGQIDDLPSLEVVPPAQLGSTLSELKLDWDNLEVTQVTLGKFVETCDLVENWFSSLA